MAGAYANPGSVNYAKLGQWYRASDFSNFLNVAQQSAFNVQTVRDGLRDAFNSIPSAPPFASDIRFPDDDAYVSGFKANWNQLITQMTTSLSYKPSIKDPKNKTVDTTDPGVDNDVVQSFYQAIKAMKELLLSPPPNDSLFSRTNFEAFFRLSWSP
ncbi:coat protein [Charavirus Namtso]|nr:coat protein [Charavirus Namtso]